MTPDRHRPPGARAKPTAAAMPVVIPATMPVVPAATTVAIPAIPANPAAIRARPPAPKVGLTTGLRHLALLAAPAGAQAGAELQRRYRPWPIARSKGPQARAPRRQRTQRRLDTRIRPRAIGDMVGIISEERRHPGFDEIRRHRAGCGQALFEQLARAMADHVAHIIGGHCRPAEHAKRMVQRRAQVGRGIDEGTVEIEDDGGRQHQSCPMAACPPVGNPCWPVGNPCWPVGNASQADAIMASRRA